MAVHASILVIEDEVWPPHQAAGDVDDVQSVIVLFVPPQVSVMPLLSDPQVGDQHLVPLILHTAQSQKCSVVQFITTA